MLCLCFTNINFVIIIFTSLSLLFIRSTRKCSNIFKFLYVEWDESWKLFERSCIKRFDGMEWKELVVTAGEFSWKYRD